MLEAVGLCVNAGGRILVADSQLPGIIEIDPVTGDQRVVSSGGIFRAPRAVLCSPAGELLVADADAGGGQGAVITVDPNTGDQSVLSSGQHFVNPFGIALDDQRQILVIDSGSDPALQGSGVPALIQVDPITGLQTVISSEGMFNDPRSLLIGNNGDILVADTASLDTHGAIIKIDRLTGTQSHLSSGGYFVDPYGIALSTTGQILIADGDAFESLGGIISVHPETGFQVPVSFGGLFRNPSGIAVMGETSVNPCETPCDCVQLMITAVEEADFPRQNKRPLIAILKAACGSFERGSDASGINQLHAVENKIRAQVATRDAELADRLLAMIQELLRVWDRERSGETD